MVHQNRSKRFFNVGATAIFLAVVAMHAAHADTTVYKYTGPNGVTVFSQSLPENYRPAAVTTITIKTLPVEQQRAAIRMMDAMQNNVDNSIQNQQSKLARADQQVNAAITNLQKAESNLQSGSVPTGGDRIGKVGGGTRLRASYFLRVEKLQHAVDHAKVILDQAYRKRNNLR